LRVEIQSQRLALAFTFSNQVYASAFANPKEHVYQLFIGSGHHTYMIIQASEPESIADILAFLESVRSYGKPRGIVPPRLVLNKPIRAAV